MKKFIYVCAMLTISTAMFAQKSNIIKADFDLKEGLQDIKKINYEKVDKAWEEIQLALSNPKTEKDPEAWSIAAHIKEVYASRIYGQKALTGELDTIAYFDEILNVAQYYSNYDKYLHTPNAKGKLPDLKELQKGRNTAQQKAIGPRNQMLQAGSILTQSHPEKSIEYLDYYFKSFDDPMFADYALRETDSLQNDANLYYAMALKTLAKTPEDTLKYIGYYEKGIKSEKYGTLACDEIMRTYKNLGNMDKWAEYCQYGIDNFPGEKYFPQQLLSYQLNNNKKEEAMKTCKVLMEKYPTDDYAFFTYGQLLFNEGKYAEALEAFNKSSEVNPNNAENWFSCGLCNWKFALDNRTNVEKCKSYINAAIPFFKKAEELAPERSELWGDPLYQAYTLLKQPNLAAPYKQYKK